MSRLVKNIDIPAGLSTLLLSGQEHIDLPLTRFILCGLFDLTSFDGIFARQALIFGFIGDLIGAINDTSHRISVFIDIPFRKNKITVVYRIFGKIKAYILELKPKRIFLIVKGCVESIDHHPSTVFERIIRIYFF